MASLDRIVAYLDRELKNDTFRDDSHNGLQVANSGKVTRVCAGVDATLPFFEEAAARGADMVVCHHGLSWGDSLKRITGMNYSRIKFLLDRDIALYASHLPLDAHPRLGNNARILKALGVRGARPFGVYHGVEIGFAGMLPKPISYATFKDRVRRMTGNELQTLDFGRKTIRSVAVVSGGAADMIEEAARKSIDVFLTGEPKLTAYHVALECGVNAVFAGHYATETFGVKALSQAITARFRVKADFVDFGIAL